MLDERLLPTHDKAPSLDVEPFLSHSKDIVPWKRSQTRDRRTRLGHNYSVGPSARSLLNWLVGNGRSLFWGPDDTCNRAVRTRKAVRRRVADAAFSKHHRLVTGPPNYPREPSYKYSGGDSRQGLGRPGCLMISSVTAIPKIIAAKTGNACGDKPGIPWSSKTSFPPCAKPAPKPIRIPPAR